MSTWRLYLILSLGLWVVSCGGSDFSAAPGDANPDASAGGSGGGPGGQAGADSGTGGTITGGNAGAGGASGAGGALTGGGAGEGGEAGSAGAAGAGGEAGMAGAAGDAGSAGAAGAGGNAGSSGASGSGGTAGSGPLCAQGQSCIEHLPTGWTPVAVGSSAPSGCFGAVYSLHSQNDLTAAQTYSCPCACTPPASSFCVSALEFLSTSACSVSAGTPVTLTTGCTPCPSTPTAPNLRFTTKLSTSCSPPMKPVIPGVGSSALACVAYAGNTPASCGDGGVCVKQFDAPTKVCLLQAGTHACPTGYSSSSSYFEGFTDTRDCAGTCACSGVCTCNGMTCHLLLHSDMSCGGATVDFTAGVCSSKPNGWGSSYSAELQDTPVGFCQASGSLHAEGSAQGTSPVTICCQP